MTALTARGGFRYPEATDNSRNVRTDITNLANDVAAKAALYVESTAASRPAPGVAGRLHRATDTGAVSWDTGTAWDDVAVSRSGGSTITTSAAGVRGLVVKGATGQTANMVEVRNSADSVRALINVDGSVVAGGSALLGRATVYTDAPGTAGLVVRGAGSQTANLAEWQDSTGRVMSAIASTGNVVIKNGDLELQLGSASGGPVAGGTNSVGSFLMQVNGVARKVPYY